MRADGGTTTTVRLSLLRAPRFPDPDTDQGVHRLGYALVPGADIADAAREGYSDQPARAARARRRRRRAAGHRRRRRRRGVEAVKLADDGSGDVVVRLYEAAGARGRARLRLGFAAGAVTVVDLLERPLPDASGDVGLDGGGVDLALRPFEVLTLRFSPIAR